MDKKLATTIEISALAVSYSAVVSVVYEFFFFLGLGTDLSHTPLSPIDFLRGWMEWTNSCRYFFLGVLTDFLIRKFKSRKSKDEKVASPISSEKTKEIPDSLVILIGLGGGTLLLLLIYGELYYSISMFGLMLILVGGIVWIALGSPLRSSLLSPQWSMFWVVIVFCGMNAFNIGKSVYDASSEPLYVTNISNDKDVEVVRVFDQWSLVRLDKRQFAWVFHQSDRVIKFTPERRQFIGAYCYFWQEYSSTKPDFCSKYRHLAVQ